ncbi:MAG: hypothetical protein VX265_14665 [Myxococcota bacterium]|nr:hypothetical protein [Myxococcota bacterium]
MLSSSLASLAVALSSTAHAGSGPWVVSPGDLSLYAGTEYQRIEELVIHDDGEEVDVIPVDDGLETFGVKAIASYGLRERIELQLEVPWYRVEANRQEGAVCTSLGLQACATTEGLGVISTQVKGLVLDELAGSPVSLSVAGLLRFGAFTSDERARLTNISEGTTDLGGSLAVGRSGGLGDGFWSAWTEVGWRHRFPNAERGGIGVPGGEMTADADVLAGLRRWWSIGPSVSMLYRPDGYDFVSFDATSPDRLGELRIFTTRIGGKLILRSNERVSVVASAHKAMIVRNNPTPISLGLGLSVQPRRKRAE